MQNPRNSGSDDPELETAGGSLLWGLSDKPLEFLVQEDLKAWLAEAPSEIRSEYSQAAFLEQKRAAYEAMPPQALRAATRAAEAKFFANVDESLDDEALSFMHPKFRADVERWGCLSSWSVEEAVALFLDRNPDCFRWADIAHYASHSALVRQAADLRRLAEDAVKAGELNERTAPQALVDWAGEQGYTFPRHLTEIVSTYEPKQAPRLSAHELWSDLSPKQQNNVFRLLLALAVDGYGFNPYRAGSRGSTAMAKSMKAVGLRLDPQTITKMLQCIKGDVDEADVEACLIERAKRGPTGPGPS